MKRGNVTGCHEYDFLPMSRFPQNSVRTTSHIGSAASAVVTSLSVGSYSQTGSVGRRWRNNKNGIGKRRNLIQIDIPAAASSTNAYIRRRQVKKDVPLQNEGKTLSCQACQEEMLPSSETLPTFYIESKVIEFGNLFPVRLHNMLRLSKYRQT
ncbi:hypothetical protein [Levyella massiliensis]|uniref:hypothetical protein n=1 Tax=Levyella massiliensis TaxID=938289 RepID=UPI0012B5F818|nr:hypothetical protein [Levyella massiliensis]